MPIAKKVSEVEPLLHGAQVRARANINAGHVIGTVKRIADDEFTDEKRAAVRLRACEILLRKVLPDLSAADINTTHGGSVTITINKL